MAWIRRVFEQGRGVIGDLAGPGLRVVALGTIGTIGECDREKGDR